MTHLMKQFSPETRAATLLNITSASPRTTSSVPSPAGARETDITTLTSLMTLTMEQSCHNTALAIQEKLRALTRTERR